MQRSLIAALVMSSALLLVGCEDEPEPTFEPTPSEATSSETASEPTDVETTDAGPVEPTLPDEAKEPTKAGAEAFVEYYWEAVSYALVTGEVDSLRPLNGPACSGCEGGLQFLKRVYDKGGSIAGGPYRVTKLSLTRYDTATGSAVFECRMETRSGDQVIRVPGEKTQHIEDVLERYTCTLLHTDGAWRLDILEPA